MTSHPARIGVVGAGPKGLYCLERLAVELARAPSRGPLEVHVFEPHSVPGAGPVYDPTQPRYLRMNFATSKIDAWSSEPNHPVPGQQRPSLVQFLHMRHSSFDDPHGYAPRALVGEYLACVFDEVISALREHASVAVHAESVRSITMVEGHYVCETARQRIACDEVVIATGHSSRTADEVVTGRQHSLGPYPIDRPGGVADIGPDGAVAVRGMGLTAIDVALALTEGRGGRFEDLDGQMGRFRYQPTANGPRTILPFSRTGRPMVPKDHPRHGPVGASFDMTFERHGDTITGPTSSPTEALAAVEARLVETGALAALSAGSAACSVGGLVAHLGALLDRRPAPTSCTIDAMVHDVEVAYGRREPGPDWALGTAWRLLYPAIVDLVASRRLDPVWDRFARLATEMERVGFGPPAENAARFLALVEAGVVDPSMAAGATLGQSNGSWLLRLGRRQVRVDHVVDAVLAPPGVGSAPSPVVRSLVDAGLARRMPRTSGLDVLDDGTCVGRCGAPSVGLAAIGRPTEGSVLGNDTLSRTLHDTPSRWARSVVRRVITGQRTSACR